MPEGSGQEGFYIPGGGSLPNRDVADPTGVGKSTSWSDVPWRTIIGAVGVVVATYALIVVLLAAGRLLMWISIAGFMAIVLAP